MKWTLDFTTFDGIPGREAEQRKKGGKCFEEEYAWPRVELYLNQALKQIVRRCLVKGREEKQRRKSRKISWRGKKFVDRTKGRETSRAL